MAKLEVTKELAQLLKNLRTKNSIKSMDLAKHINKSAAYISRLEKGDIKTIEYDDLKNIFEYISKEKSPSELLEEITKDYINQNSTENIDYQSWLLNFDSVYRQIPISPSLIDYINSELAAQNLSVQDIVDIVNKNEDLTGIDVSKYPKNRWQFENNDKFIVMELSTTRISDILTGKRDVANYVTLQSILYNLFKRIEIDPVTAYTRAMGVLSNHKFYSLIEKEKILHSKRTEEEISSMLTEFDNENRNYVNVILKHIKTLSEWRIKTTNQQLCNLIKSLDWDPPFTLKVISLNYYDLNNLSVSLKKEFISKIENLITEYKDLPEEKKSLEEY